MAVATSAGWREAARRVLGVLGSRSAIDSTGLSIPQVALVATMAGGRFDLVGSVTYLCHTCGQLITRPWECLYVDDTPGAEWASTITPPTMTKRTTTHHDWHMASGGD
jgi:hypothetical protein